MATTKIEWVKNPDGTRGHSWNPIVGCTNSSDCAVREHCWGVNIKRRFSGGCEQCRAFVPHFHPEQLGVPLKRKKPTTYFFADCADWCDPLFTREDMWVHGIPACFEIMHGCSQHIFLSLTKRTDVLAGFYGGMKDRLFPDNLWVGASVCTEKDLYRIDDLHEFVDRLGKPVHRFVSFEPLYGNLVGDDRIEFRDYIHGLSWVIIGTQTNPNLQPKYHWVRGIIDCCVEEGVPVFLKDNLNALGVLMVLYDNGLREIPYLNNSKQITQK